MCLFTPASRMNLLFTPHQPQTLHSSSSRPIIPPSPPPRHAVVHHVQSPPGKGPLSIVIMADPTPILPRSMVRILSSANPPTPSLCPTCDKLSGDCTSLCGKCTSFPARCPNTVSAHTPDDGGIPEAPRPSSIRVLEAPRLILRCDQITVVEEEEEVEVEEKEAVKEEDTVNRGYQVCDALSTNVCTAMENGGAGSERNAARSSRSTFVG